MKYSGKFLKPSLFFTLLVGSIIIMILFNSTVRKERKVGPERTSTIAHDRLLKIPRRPSNYTLLTSSMEVKWDDIPDWISCPPAVIIPSSALVRLKLIYVKKTSQSIWSMAVTEKEVLYSSVSALSIKVN